MQSAVRKNSAYAYFRPYHLVLNKHSMSFRCACVCLLSAKINILYAAYDFAVGEL